MAGHNRGKVILDLCGGSGAWSKPYKDAGYDVRVLEYCQR
jgi:ubiquinone/menaquinone biosynthesis C-methylase UbiE